MNKQADLPTDRAPDVSPAATGGADRGHARRVVRGLRKPANWVQLVKFSIVGGSGYVVNLIVFSTMVELVGINYRAAAVIAFCVAVTNNFLLNRHWTFSAGDGRAGFQAARFLVVSLIALAFNLTVLEVLVSGFDMAEIPAQAIAILAATPLNFIGNKLWSFRDHSTEASEES
jgi:putative flippase GtrA